MEQITRILVGILAIVLGVKGFAAFGGACFLRGRVVAPCHIRAQTGPTQTPEAPILYRTRFLVYTQIPDKPLLTEHFSPPTNATIFGLPVEPQKTIRQVSL